MLKLAQTSLKVKKNFYRRSAVFSALSCSLACIGPRNDICMGDTYAFCCTYGASKLRKLCFSYFQAAISTTKCISKEVSLYGITYENNVGTARNFHT